MRDPRRRRRKLPYVSMDPRAEKTSRMNRTSSAIAIAPIRPFAEKEAISPACRESAGSREEPAISSKYARSRSFTTEGRYPRAAKSAARTTPTDDPIPVSPASSSSTLERPVSYETGPVSTASPPSRPRNRSDAAATPPRRLASAPGCAPPETEMPPDGAEGAETRVEDATSTGVPSTRTGRA